MLPPGVYGEADAGRGAGSAGGQRLLTASMDGTLRLWDVSVDLLSLEVSMHVHISICMYIRRCVFVFCLFVCILWLHTFFLGVFVCP